jgi:hypothetical protein
MTLYARSDVMHVSLGVHGCGASHSREVTRGVPAKIFKIDCTPCESHLKGDHKPQKLVYETDPKSGQVVRQARVPDSDPMYSSTPDTVPLTPDEERTNTVRSERGRMQIEMLQALAALRSTGIEVPPEAMWLLERELPAGMLAGTVVCANSHDVPAGSGFCPQCGVSMAARGVLGSAADAEPEAPAVVDLGRLHVATLRKRCRDAGLPDKGSKDVLIGRLEAA